ncbi:flagellar hook-length control protein FliK [Bradyrhizobium sp. WSM471]|uniref:flagellar hook-length control protein FliK n=1 Tax=Bradyrhizobium sp. WSM471 TaxID=319017 RepID=UPI00056B0AF4|nr:MULTISPECIES: flagellar hook-length control protein FliK [Bradyrhizobium]UFW40518.1 flagellar hook-length control protein FliK [Bradyrhizobium canariense]
MVGRTSDVAASVQVQSAQQKPARSQAPKESSANDSFGSLVDSNTQAISDSAASSAQDTPRRTDSSSAASDKSPRDRSVSDKSSQSKASDDTDKSASAKNDAKNDAKSDARNDAKSDSTADAAKADSKTKDKPKASDAKSADKSADKSDQTKADKADGTDGLAAAVDTAAAAQIDAAQAALPDPNALVVAVPVDPNAAANQTAGSASSPLTIAAAGIAASASITAQIAGPKTDTATPGDKSAKTASAKVDADTSATLADAATGTTDSTATDAKTNGGLIAAADQGTPKTSFKAAAIAQGASDVSNIGQDTGKANAAQTPATAASANTAHPHADKPTIDANAADAKAGTSDRTADAAPATATTHAHAGTQAAVPTTDTSAQAASAIQAPLTNTTSAATASTATLTATAANANAIPISGVPIEIAAAARAGKTRFDISLDPLDLGRIDVRINVDRNGQVTSHLTVEKPETLQMLRQDAPQLQRALDDAGLKTGSNGLSFSLRDQNSSGQNSGQNNDNGGNARRLIVSDEDAVPAAPVGRSYGRMLGSSSGVDIRV